VIGRRHPGVPRRVAIIQGHPDPGGNRLCHALADAYALGAGAAGHEVTRVEVARLEFSILRTKEEFEAGRLPESLVEAQRAIVSAQHLVVLFPLWHGTMPALLKAFLEQVMRPGIALEYREHGLSEGATRRAFGAARGYNGHAGADLPMVFQSTRGARVRTQHPQICWDEACPRDPVGDGRRGERCQAAKLA
jgi:NAD(P)H-dependent FMN reductase